MPARGKGVNCPTSVKNSGKIRIFWEQNEIFGQNHEKFGSKSGSVWIQNLFGQPK